MTPVAAYVGPLPVSLAAILTQASHLRGAEPATRTGRGATFCFTLPLMA